MYVVVSSKPFAALVNITYPYALCLISNSKTLIMIKKTIDKLTKHKTRYAGKAKLS